MKTFNPTDFGAIEVKPFNPSDFGATPTDSFNQAMGELHTSQTFRDKLNAEATQAKIEAEKAQSIGGIAKETLKGTAAGLAPVTGGILGAVAGGAVGGPPGAIIGAGAGTAGGYALGQTIKGEDIQAKDVATAGAVGGLAQGTGGLLTTAGRLIGQGVKKLPGASKVTSFFEQRAAKKAEEKAVSESIDAVYSSPTGKKFVKTSSQVLGGQREITPASIFREQGLTPDQQTVNLGTRLKELKLGKDPVKNTQILADDFANTETKLQVALKGDPDVIYLADKQTLLGKLNNVKTEAPQEFRIKDSQAMVNRVVDFGNKLVAKVDDSIGGVRDARIAFDTQAKREFPNAFKPDGTIDTKTPAGYAIKKVRDDINEHLYNTAPNGSEIQTLIGREADLYRAAQVSLEKALKGEGKKALAQWAQENPTKAKILESLGLITIGGIGVGILKSGN